AHGAHIGQEHDRALPDLPVEAGLRQLGAGDGVSAAADIQTLLGDLPDDADAQAGAGEGLAGRDGLGYAEFAADGPDLVLEQGAQRFDEFELDVIGQTADVVVALDVRCAGTAAGLDDIGVQGALDEEGDLLALVLGLEHEVGGGGLEGADELAADDLALLLRVGDPGQLGQELLARVHGDQADADRGDVVLLDLGPFVLTQQAVVDEDAGELIADGLVHKRGGHRGVDASGQSADDLLLSHA